MFHLQEFQEAYDRFITDTRGRLAEFGVDELKERKSAWEDARQQLYDAVEDHCEDGSIEVVLDEDTRVTITDPAWFSNGTWLRGDDEDGRFRGVNLMEANRIVESTNQ